MIRWFHVEPTGPVIPTPEAGVCTTYPIAIPVTSGLIHYSSPFNWCDNHDDLAGTIDMTLPPPTRWRNVQDLSGSANPQLPATLADSRRITYNDDGTGDVYWTSGVIGGSTTRSEINTSWVIGTDVKTILFLAKRPISTSTIQLMLLGSPGATRFRLWTSAAHILQVTDGGTTNATSITVSADYHVYSVRADATVIAGLNQIYEQVKASPAVANASPITFGGINEFNIAWGGSMRDLAIFDRALSDAEVDTMVDYMKAKWGL